MEIKKYHNPMRIKEVWQRLYQEALVKNPFSEYSVNYEYKKAFNINIHNIRKTAVFYYCKEGIFEAIIPVVIDKQTKTISEFAPLDYYDILANGPDNFVRKAMSEIISKFSDYHFCFSRVYGDGILYSLMKELYGSTERCAEISIKGKSYNDYYSLLSKSQRQNIRTSYNRLAKSNITISMKMYDQKKKVPNKLWEKLVNIYFKRRETLHQVSPLFIKKTYHKIFNPLFKVIKKSNNSGVFVLFFNEVPVAYMGGLFNKKMDTFSVPLLTMDDSFSFYSPGIILINEVLKLLLDKNFSSLDLALGHEPYKYTMGAEDYFAYYYNYPCSHLLKHFTCVDRNS